MYELIIKCAVSTKKKNLLFMQLLLFGVTKGFLFIIVSLSLNCHFISLGLGLICFLAGTEL